MVDTCAFLQSLRSSSIRTISPNVGLTFRRMGIDPYQDRFEITLHNDGTIRGIGGVQVHGVDGGTGIAGLFVVGDNASREKVAGAISGGGNVNSAWALTSGALAGHSAAALARKVMGWGWPPLSGLGEAGIRPRRHAAAFDIAQARRAVQGEMHPYDKNIFRRGDQLAASFATIDAAWQELRNHAAPGADALALRETAALLATSRWSLATAQARTESRGMHKRVDAPHTDPTQAHRLLVSGFDAVNLRADAPRAAHALEAAE